MNFHLETRKEKYMKNALTPQKRMRKMKVWLGVVEVVLKFKIISLPLP